MLSGNNSTQDAGLPGQISFQTFQVHGLCDSHPQPYWYVYKRYSISFDFRRERLNHSSQNDRPFSWNILRTEYFDTCEEGSYSRPGNLSNRFMGKSERHDG